MLVHIIVAARPNFVKASSLYRELAKQDDINVLIIHTGQHYDDNMSQIFFDELNLPKPDINLEVGSGTHAAQTGMTMMQYEKICINHMPDLVIVIGDVNATLACAITAKKLGIEVAHLEAGIRSNDHSMPEEINRRVTDSICDYFWTPSEDASDNLMNEGVSENKIRMVGNIMIDAIEFMRPTLKQNDIFKTFRIKKNSYGLVTFHRPANVDNPAILEKIIEELNLASQYFPIIFPLHPRTRERLNESNMISLFNDRIKLTNPLSYKAFMSLLLFSKIVITDSGGIQEETTYLQIPCLTVRQNTERPITIWEGTNSLVKPEEIFSTVQNVINRDYNDSKIPHLWDGKTASRVIDHILDIKRLRDVS